MPKVAVRKQKVASQYLPYAHSTYTTDTCRHNQFIKEECNQLFAAQVKETTENALVLDAEEANTAAMLIENGLCRENIHCPNYDKEVVKKMRAKGMSTVHHMMLSEFLTKHADIQFNRVWFDFCWTWKRSKSDVKTLLENKMLANNGTFAITVSMHGEKGKLFNKRNVIMNWINRQATKNNYQFSVKECFFYGKSASGFDEKDICNSSSMLFMMFDVNC